MDVFLFDIDEEGRGGDVLHWLYFSFVSKGRLKNSLECWRTAICSSVGMGWLISWKKPNCSHAFWIWRMRSSLVESLA